MTAILRSKSSKGWDFALQNSLSSLDPDFTLRLSDHRDVLVHAHSHSQHISSAC